MLLENRLIIYICPSFGLSKHLDGYKNMIIINIKENESIDKALKRFKKKFEKTGVMKELRARTYFEKPSVRKRNIRLRAAYRQAMLAESNKA